MDEDAEFRDIVVKHLENNGILQDIRAKLRTHIYALVDDDAHPKTSTTAQQQPTQSSDCTDLPPTTVAVDTTNATDDRNNPHGNLTMTTSTSSENMSIALSLVQDLLDSLNLTYTSSVLAAELKQSYSHWSRRRIADVLQLAELDETVGVIGNNATESDSLEVRSDIQVASSSSSAVRTELESTASDSYSNSGFADGEELSKTATDKANVVENGCSIGRTPLLVEILRRLPKITDESMARDNDESSSIATRVDGLDDINNETFVAAANRSANQTSESL